MPPCMWLSLMCVVSNQQESQLWQLDWNSFVIFMCIESASEISQGFAVSLIPKCVWFLQLVELTLKFLSIFNEHNLFSFEKQLNVLFSLVGVTVAALCQGCITSIIPTMHNVTHNSFCMLVLSSAQALWINMPKNMLDELWKHWAEVTGIKAHPIKVAVVARVRSNEYKNTTGTSGTGTIGDLCFTNIQTVQVTIIPEHLKTCSSRSGILLCSNWTLVIPTMWQTTSMKAQMMPFSLSSQGILCSGCISSGSVGLLCRCRSLWDSFKAAIYMFCCLRTCKCCWFWRQEENLLFCVLWMSCFV